MFEKVNNILGDKSSKEYFVYCSFGDRISIERQNSFSSISIMSVQHYENIADKLKICTYDFYCSNKYGTKSYIKI